MDALNYEELVSEFNNKLVTQLRGHGAAVEFLEMWVPDADTVRSLLNMIEAAQAYGQKDICVRVAKDTLSTAQFDQLRSEAANLGTLTGEREGSGNWLIKVTGL